MRCTMCGKEFDAWDESGDFVFEKQVGYGSVHDGENFKLNLCCECFDRFVDLVTPMCKCSVFSGDDDETRRY